VTGTAEPAAPPSELEHRLAEWLTGVDRAGLRRSARPLDSDVDGLLAALREELPAPCSVPVGTSPEG
jgi:hypothetical protein